MDGQFDGIDVQLALMDLDPQDAIHELRKHTKRLRALLRLLRPVLKQSKYRKQNQALRTIAQSFASQRDSDAFSETLERLSVRLRQTFSNADLVAIQDRLSEHQHQNRHALHVLIENAFEQTMVCRKGCEKLDVKLSRKQLCELFLTSYIQSQKRFKKVNQSSQASDFHNWRKSVKALYYQSQLLRKNGVNLPKSFRKDLNLLGETLGEYQDVSMLIERVEADPELLLDLVDQPTFIQELNVARNHIGRRAQVLALVLLARKPKRFRKLYLRS